jgi:DUF2934 family protein
MNISMDGLDHTTIARRAYLLWNRRGRPFGSPETDWYEAIRELSYEKVFGEEEKVALPFSDYSMEPDEA